MTHENPRPLVSTALLTTTIIAVASSLVMWLGANGFEHEMWIWVIPAALATQLAVIIATGYRWAKSRVRLGWLGPLGGLGIAAVMVVVMFGIYIASPSFNPFANMNLDGMDLAGVFGPMCN